MTYKITFKTVLIVSIVIILTIASISILIYSEGLVNNLNSIENKTHIVIYISYPYKTNGTFQVNVDNKIVVNENNYSFSILPPYTKGYNENVEKGNHILTITDSTYNQTEMKELDVKDTIYVTIEVNENGIRFILQNEQPIFLYF